MPAAMMFIDPRQKFKIAVLKVAADNVLNNRKIFLRALAALGHEIKVFPLSPTSYDPGIKSIREFHPDFLLFFCMDYRVIYRDNIYDYFLSSFPYVTLWDSNPLRSLYFLKKHTENHLGMFMMDSHIVETLHNLGFESAVYFPYYYTDFRIFKPLPPSEEYSHPISFAGTFVPTTRIPSFYKNSAIGDAAWTDIMKDLKKDFEEKRNSRPEYIDVFDYLNGKTDLWNKEFAELSDHLMYSQKWIERIQLFKLLSDAKLETHVYGGYKLAYSSRNLNETISFNSPYIHLHDFLDKHTQLPTLYNSSKINLCCTQFPRACHERVFQTAACGAFILHEYKEDASALFEPGKEIVMYKKLEELPDLIKYYLKNEDERKKIAANARKRFLSEHTPLHRAKKFMEIIIDRLET
jgi:spore maturation protein CgeB